MAKAREMGGQGKGDGRLNEAGKLADELMEFGWKDEPLTSVLDPDSLNPDPDSLKFL